MLHIVVGEDSILIYKSFEIIRRLFFFVRHGRERAITQISTQDKGITTINLISGLGGGFVSKNVLDTSCLIIAGSIIP
jgi:hypothetical protein